MIRFQCPECAKSLTVDDSKAGMAGACPGCKVRIRIPTPAGRSSEQVIPKPGPVRTPDRISRRRPAGAEEDPVEDFTDELPEERISTSTRRHRPQVDAPDDPLPRSRHSRREADDEDEGQESRPRCRRRDVEDDEDETERVPRRRALARGAVRSRRSHRSSGVGLDPTLMTALGIGIVAVFLAGLSFLFPPLSILPVGIGVLMAIAGGLWLLVVAFSDSPVQGLLCMFLPFYSLVYTLTHLDETRNPLFLYLAGFALIMLGGCAGGGSTP